jgi:hypothetical protein
MFGRHSLILSVALKEFLRREYRSQESEGRNGKPAVRTCLGFDESHFG